MNDRNLKQVDILKKTEPFCKKYGVKMNKSDISQYVSGKNEPGQDKLTMLGMALNVSEVWLMGYDVPMERHDYEDQTILRFDAELEDALNIITSDGYLWSYSKNPECDIIIKNSSGKIVDHMQDYELVNKYESIQRKGGPLNANSLLDLNKNVTSEANSSYNFDDKDHHLSRIIHYYQCLNKKGQEKAYEYISDLAEQPKYSQLKTSTKNAFDETSCSFSPTIRFTDVNLAKAYLKSQNLAAWQNTPPYR